MVTMELEQVLRGSVEFARINIELVCVNVDEDGVERLALLAAALETTGYTAQAFRLNEKAHELAERWAK